MEHIGHVAAIRPSSPYSNCFVVETTASLVEGFRTLMLGHPTEDFDDMAIGAFVLKKIQVKGKRRSLVVIESEGLVSVMPENLMHAEVYAL